MRNVLVLAFVLLVMMFAVPVGAQTGSTIHGTVTDASGAALPGVSATLTSPALQVGQETTVTGAGRDLPIRRSANWRL